MVDEIGKAVNWPRIAEQLGRTAEVPALVVRGSWDNRPPLAEPQHGAFELRHLAGGLWLLDDQAHDDWVGTPAGLIASPGSWFREPETSAVELPGREMVAGRACRRLLVDYSRHSAYRMVLWVDSEWPLVLAARSQDSGRLEQPRFEVRATEVRTTVVPVAGR